MAFRLPTFNLLCSIWTNGLGPPSPSRLFSACNLAYGQRVPTQIQNGVFNQYGMQLLLPAGTDIRGPQSASGEDLVEVPSGSGRFYLVYFCDDVGKGFANEHRLAVLLQFGIWPTPMP